MATPRTYRSNMGDMIDYICWKYYGNPQSGYVETILELPTNYRLSDLNEVLPMNTVIDLPPIELPAPPLRRLWD